jgi:peptidyl-tRNA hydrolase ICT1
LHALIVELGRNCVPNETAAGQSERVERLQKAEAAGRRRLKERLSGKKAARRGGGRGED